MYHSTKLTLVALSCLLMLAACSSEGPTRVPAKMAFDNSDELGVVTLEYSSKSATQSLSFKADGSWHVSIPGSASWLSISPSSGTGDATIQVSVTANPNKESRKAIVSFVCDGIEQKVQLKVFQDQLYVREIVFDGKSAYVPRAGGVYNVNVKPTYVNDWKAESSASWLKVEKVDKDHLKITADACTGDPRTAQVTLIAIGTEEEVSSVTPFIQWLKGDVLDVEFSEAGATDIAQGRTIDYLPNSAACVVAMHSEWGTWVPSFNHDMGGSSTTGIYKTDIDDTMMGCLNDGFSMEAVVMLKAEPNGKEIKAFSSTKGGGFAIMVNSSSRGNDLTFLLNNGAWQFIKTGVTPQPGVYYHVLGTWDQAKGVSKVYLNGELMGEYDVPGDLRYGSLSPNYITIGANQNTATSCNGSWTGDVVSAKIFNDPLTPAQIQARYHDYAPYGLEIVFTD